MIECVNGNGQGCCDICLHIKGWHREWSSSLYYVRNKNGLYLRKKDGYGDLDLRYPRISYGGRRDHAFSRPADPQCGWKGCFVGNRGKVQGHDLRRAAVRRTQNVLRGFAVHHLEALFVRHACVRVRGADQVKEGVKNATQENDPSFVDDLHLFVPFHGSFVDDKRLRGCVFANNHESVFDRGDRFGRCLFACSHPFQDFVEDQIFVIQ